MDQQQSCVILFPTGAMLVEYRRDPDAWVSFNRMARKDCALFVDKELRHSGDRMTADEAKRLFTERWKIP